MLLYVGCSSSSSPVASATADGGSGDDAAHPSGADAGSEGDDPDAAPTELTDADTTKPGYVRLLAEAERILAAEKHTTYQHTTQVDEATGVFDFDCSGFVDYALARSVPAAFDVLAKATVARPLAKNYVEFIDAIPSSAASSWRRVARAADLVGGDIVAWLEPPDASSSNTGHVMIVAGAVSDVSGEIYVPIIDSTETGHGSTDPRTINGTTGLGRGTIALIVNSKGAPTAYRWSTDNGTRSDATTIALAHLP